MSALKNIIVDTPEDYVLRVRINRPGKRNAIDYNVREEIYNALENNIPINSDGNERDTPRKFRALIFGGVDGNLSAGGDLPSMEGLSRQEAVDRLAHIHRLCRYVANIDVPVLTCVNGAAAGAAIGLALLGDYIIGERNSRIIVPFLKLGLIPDWGMIQTLPARVGLPAARRMMFESQTIDAEEAHKIGFFDTLVDEGAGEVETIKKATRLAQLPMHAFGLVKRQLSTPNFNEILDDELSNQVGCLTGPEFDEGFKSFMEKRRADFKKL